jgi:uncharacterized membrane protein
MIEKSISIILFIVGIINLLPLIVFFDIAKTTKLYGIPIEGESLTILMRHRGVLLSLVGIALIAAAFKTDYRILAIALALISKFAFIFLTFSSAEYSAEIRQVALIDVGAIFMLLVVLGLHFYGK